MGRMQLVELEDLDACPAVLRDAGTAFLRTAAEVTRLPKVFAPVVEELLDRTGEHRIVDLCSGGGGPVPAIAAEVAAGGRDLEVLLTDKFPNLPALNAIAEASAVPTRVVAEPVDATAVPAEMTGVRTIFNAFHHFPPELARKVLADAAAARAPIGVFEFLERRPLTTLGMLPLPLFVAALMPFIRPVRPSWWFLTYVLPLVPALVLWDGFVSSLRIYDEDELRELTDGLGGDGYTWEIRRIPLPGMPARGTALLGLPADPGPGKE